MFIELGNWIVSTILTTANAITGEDYAPGLVSFVLIVLLVVLIVVYLYKTKIFHEAVYTVMNILKVEKEERFTSTRLSDIEQKFKEIANKGKFNQRLERAWEEFNETAKSADPDDDNDDILKNTVRPSYFFNREELGIEHGFWKQVPTLFVSVGLFLTFLGLVAALDQTSTTLEKALGSPGVPTTDGLLKLLKVASAKFTMSLTGLACSIVFTVVLRATSIKTDKLLQELCESIEIGCTFQTEQILLEKLLTETKEHTSHLKFFSTELVAQVATPLKEDVPNAIRDAIENTLAPAIEKLSQYTDEGVGNLVRGVSGELAGGIEESTLKMTDKIESVLEIMNKTTKQFNLSIQEELLIPLKSLIEQTSNFIDQVEESAKRVEKFGISIEESRFIYEQSSAQIKGILIELKSVAEPMHRMLEQVDSTSRQSVDQIELVSDAMLAGVREITKSTESVISDTFKGIQVSENIVREGLLSLEAAVQNFRNVANNFDEIDEKLGDAFNKISSNVDTSISAFKEFQEKLNKEFGEALNRLDAVIAKTEPFEPRRKDN